MSAAKRVAESFNSWAREGRDMMGGADGSAIADLLNLFLEEPGSEPHPSSDCKSTAYL
jgi:hypothetical protein